MRRVLEGACAALVATWIAIPAGLALRPQAPCETAPCEESAGTEPAPQAHLGGVLSVVAIAGTVALIAFLRGRRHA